MKEVRLGDVADVYISGVDKKTLPNEVPVRLCNYTDVYYNWAIRKEKHQTFMLASAKQDEIAKFRLHTGQVAITKDSETRDDIGHATFIANDFEDVILGYHCALITPCAGKLDGQYLNALFRMHYVSDYLSRNAGGRTARRSRNWRHWRRPFMTTGSSSSIFLMPTASPTNLPVAKWSGTNN